MSVKEGGWPNGGKGGGSYHWGTSRYTTSGGGDNHVGGGFTAEVNGTSTMYGNGLFKIEYVGN
ncbi:MAG: hypothetical protein LBH18_03660 [Spirochaetaceae bacterium]|jgi:hypothetical protein|nr:hypothetical protein [Spirochaetaceae bacterium]